MKKMSLALILTAFLSVGLANEVAAQQKIGCINSNELIASMPANDSAMLVMEQRTQAFVKQSEELQVELNKKYEEYLVQRDSIAPLIRQSKETELNDMSKNIENFNSAADQELQRVRQEIYQPILAKAQNAIKEVSNEGGFTYIIDIGTNSLLIFPEEAPLNILEAVKKKLGID